MGLSGVTSLINLPQYFGGTVKPISVYWSSTYITAIGDHCWNIDVSIGGVLNIPTFHIPLVTLPHSTWFKIPKIENYPWGVVNLLLFLQPQNITPNHLSPNLWCLYGSDFWNASMIDTLRACFQSVSFLDVIHFGSIKDLHIHEFVSYPLIHTALGSKPNSSTNPPSSYPFPHTWHNLIISPVINITCTTAVYLWVIFPLCMVCSWSNVYARLLFYPVLLSCISGTIVL